MRTGTKGPQVILSRRDPELIKTLFELEVPEIADGLVEIRGVAREPGYRSKIAVESHAQGVDPVGACVGPRGSRVRMVVSELRGEKIDIIPWNSEPARFVAKALSPARVREVYLDDEAREATVVVPDDQLALAIGKEGMNARLAARLTGWKVDIVSDSEFAQQEADAAYGVDGEDGEDVSGRCAAILSNGKRCPNASLPGSKYCGVPAHQGSLAGQESEVVDGRARPRTSSRPRSRAVAAAELGARARRRRSRPRLPSSAETHEEARAVDDGAGDDRFGRAQGAAARRPRTSCSASMRSRAGSFRVQALDGARTPAAACRASSGRRRGRAFVEDAPPDNPRRPVARPSLHWTLTDAERKAEQTDQTARRRPQGAAPGRHRGRHRQARHRAAPAPGRPSGADPAHTA